MAQWHHTVEGVRSLIQGFDADNDSPEANVRAVWAIISRRSCFDEFMWMDDMEDFENDCNQEEDMERANELFCAMYDFADSERIWLA